METECSAFFLINHISLIIRFSVDCIITSFTLPNDSLFIYFFMIFPFESGKYSTLSPMSVNYASTRKLVEDGGKSNATLHFPSVRPCSGLHCTLTPTCSPHLSPGLLISSVICQGYLEDRKQDISRENVMPASPFRAAAVLSDSIRFLPFACYFPLSRWKMSAGLWRLTHFNASRHSRCYRRMNEDSRCWLIPTAELRRMCLKHGFSGPIRILANCLLQDCLE